MRPALSHHDPADRRPAGRAKLARTPVDLVLQLEASLFAIGIDVVIGRGDLARRPRLSSRRSAPRLGPRMHPAAVRLAAARKRDAGQPRADLDRVLAFGL